MLEIVSVTYRRGKKGWRESWVFEDFSVNRPDPEGWPEDLPLYDWNGNSITAENRPYGGVYLDLPTDWFGLRFDFTGQFFDNQQSALQHEYEQSSGEDVFGDWADELRVIGEKLIEEETERRKKTFDSDPSPSQAVFLTAWDYRGGRDYEGEYFSEWDLLGLIDFSRIQELVVKEVKAHV
jgi:hypothetical protein